MTRPQPTRLDPTHFDSKARQWDDNPVFRERGLKIAEAIRQAVPLHRGMRALDYGCGTGLLSFPLQDELGAILLADSSRGMLEVANEKIVAQGATHLRTRQLDLLADPAPSERFDLIVTAMTLHHVPDTDRILAVFHDLLNPGGYLCIADLDREDGSFHGPEVDVHHGFDRAELGRRVAGAGFADPQFQTVFAITKESGAGTRDYPVFLMIARRADANQTQGDAMPTILVEKPDADRLARLGVERWPVWEKEISEFPWSYADRETSYFLEGRVIVTPAGGEPVEIVQGDLATFPAGLDCTWQVLAPLRKRYRFG